MPLTGPDSHETATAVAAEGVMLMNPVSHGNALEQRLVSGGPRAGASRSIAADIADLLGAESCRIENR